MAHRRRFSNGLASYLKRYATTFRKISGLLEGLAADIKGGVDTVRHGFNCKAARRFVELMAPFAADDPQYLLMAAAIFAEIADFFDDIADQMQYMKIVVILEMIELVAKFAIAFYMAAFTAGGSLSLDSPSSLGWSFSGDRDLEAGCWRAVRPGLRQVCRLS